MQVEYAGVLKNSPNLEAAQKLLDYLLSVDFQNEIPDSLYMYPVTNDAEIPGDWEKFAPEPPSKEAEKTGLYSFKVTKNADGTENYEVGSSKPETSDELLEWSEIF
jgi:ABC-type thiamine transport system substrate-binding protein